MFILLILCIFSSIYTSEHSNSTPNPPIIYTLVPPPLPKFQITQKKFEEIQRTIFRASKKEDLEDLKAIQNKLISELDTIEKIDGTCMGLWKFYKKKIEQIQEKINAISLQNLKQTLEHADTSYMDTKNTYSSQELACLQSFIPAQEDILKRIQKHKERIQHYESMFATNSARYLNCLIKIVEKAKASQFTQSEYDQFKREVTNAENIGRDMGMIPADFPYIIEPADISVEKEQTTKKTTPWWRNFFS